LLLEGFVVGLSNYRSTEPLEQQDAELTVTLICSGYFFLYGISFF